MVCSICRHENPAEARFCGQCGSPLVSVADTPAVTGTPAPPTAYAGFLQRLVALIIDFIVVNIGSSVLTLLLATVATAGGLGLAFLGVNYLVGIVFPPLYFVLMTGLRGQTLGKMALGTRVVDQEGRAPGVRRAALLETIGKSVSAVVFFVGFLWVLWDDQKRSWHDKIAGTYVIISR